MNLFFRGGYFKEDRVNGKVGEVNDTEWTSLAGGVRVRMPDQSDLQATVFGDDSTFHSTFLAVTATSATVPPRSIVRLATDQNVPTTGVGTMIQWSRAIGQKHFFSTGFDWRHVDGDSLEDAYIATSAPRSFRQPLRPRSRCSATPAARRTATASFCRTWSASTTSC